ncbi:MAG: D-arabinono-1,4-lactone oxidase [Lacunisphaera sp.]
MQTGDWYTHNWSGHLAYHATGFHQPTTIAEVQEIVRRAAQVRVIGSRHCFNDIADSSGDLLWLSHLNQPVVIDQARRTARVDAGITYEKLCPILTEAGFALPNLASLKHITVIGACTTATHGSGNALGNLATVVSAIEMITPDGALIELTREHDGDTFRGAVVALGALGVVTRLTLDLEPSFLVQQDNYEHLPLRDVYAHFDEITGAGDSVSMFLTWQNDWVETTWVKRRVPDLTPVEVPRNLFGATLASAQPSGVLPTDRTLTPFARPGLWHERLPHYALHDPVGLGNELQSEYFVPRRHAVAAIQAVAGLRERLAPILGLSEIRTIRADNLWLSSAYGEDSVGLHFNWLKKWDGVRPFLPLLEQALAPFEARPHLGKLFAMSAPQLESVYPRWQDFRALRQRFDPQGKFANRFVRQHGLAPTEPG